MYEETQEAIPLQPDNAQKELMRELVAAINDTMSKSDRIAEAVYKVRAAGLDVELSLNGTINVSSWPEGAINVKGHPFLKSMRVGVDFGDGAHK